MEVSATTQPASASGADTVVVGVLDGGLTGDDAPPELAALVSSGEARDSFKSLALAHAGGKRWLAVGLGKSQDFTAERARVAAAIARDRSRELATGTLCWQLPEDAGEQIAAALVEGTILSDYRFERHKSTPAEPDADAPPKHLQALVVQSAQDVSVAVAEAALIADAVNAARDLQNRPANDLTPTALGAYAQALARDIDGLSVEVEGREEIVARGMGAFAAVAQGSDAGAAR